MSPQFVDLNADGRDDIVAGTYDGSPYVAFGGEKGFAEPKGILDKGGKRIVQNAFWNFDTKEWDSTTRCNPEGDDASDAHGTSAFAIDWDRDGDLDLLLGDYKGGRLFLRENEGSVKEAAYAERNRLVMAGGKPLVVEGGLSTMRVCDWNGDGLPDLLLGSMGDCFGKETGGGVDLWLNSGKPGAPAFDKPTTLVPRSKKGHEEIARPDSGLYMDLGDVDGDGDQDLVVGAYSHWQPPARKLDEKEEAEAKRLQTEIDSVRAKQQKIMEEMNAATRGLEKAEAKKKRDEIWAQKEPEYSALREEIEKLGADLHRLVPAMQRVSYTWLYENRSK